MILAFYSYKGGVGRTSLALDTAARLALGSEDRPPLRVLVWDLDLDAPGVRHFPALQDVAKSASVGTRDLLALLEASPSITGALPEVSEAEVLDVLRRAIVADPNVAGGRLSLLLPAGTRTAESGLAHGDVAQLFGPGAPGPSLLVLAADLARRKLGFDVVIVDARTGINDLSATATTVLADCAVLVFRLDGQDVAHISEIVTAIHEAWDRAGAAASDVPNRLYRVANLVPQGDQEVEATVEVRRRELAELRLAPHLELPLRPLALVRESTPSLDGPELDPDTESAVEDLADWVYQRWVDLLQREGVPRDVSVETQRVRSGASAGKRLMDEVAALLRMGGWRVTMGKGVEQIPFGLRAEKVGEFGRRQALYVECTPSQRGVTVAHVERLSALAAAEPNGIHREAMLVARGFTRRSSEAARVHNVILVTPEELLDDLAPSGPLRKRAKELWEGTALERQYVPPTALVLDVEGAPTREETPLDELALSWLGRGKPGLLCVVGDFGAGKTTFCQKLAAALAADEKAGAPVPLFVDLRTAGSTALTLDGLLRHALDQAKLDQSRLEPWRFRLAQGSLVLLVDGFDELLGYTDPARMEGLLEELQRAAAGGRVVLTSRSSYFRSDRDAARALRGQGPENRGTALWHQLTTHGEGTVLEVQPFSDEQVHTYLSRRFGEDAVESILQRLRMLHPVDDLLRRPYLLALVATSIDLWEARGWPSRLTLTSVYESYVADWLARDERKNRGLPATPASLAQHLARVLWNRSTARIGSRELRREAASWGSAASGRAISPDEEEIIEAKVRTALFLVRDERGAYRFAHRSFLEFFVAKDLAEMFSGEPTLEAAQKALDTARLTPEIATFLAGWPEAWSPLQSVCNVVLEAPPAYPRASTNALLLAVWSGRAVAGSGDGEHVIIPRAELAQVDLSRADLAAVTFRNANLSGADLAGADLSGADLRKSDLRGIFATQANFTRADMQEALATDAVLSEATLAHAQLAGADLSRADLRRASLQHADLSRCHMIGASLSQADISDARTEGTDLSGSRAVGVIADGVDLSASRLDDADMRFASLRGATMPPHSIAHVYAARFAPDPEVIRGAGVGHLALQGPESVCEIVLDGRAFVAVGCSDGSVRVWDPETGSIFTAHTVHGTAVLCLSCLTYDGRVVLASCGSDGVIALWELSPGAKHEATVRPTAFKISESAVEAFCAVTLVDGTSAIAAAGGPAIVVWDAQRREVIARYNLDAAYATALCAVSLPDGGPGLASACRDAEGADVVYIWDLRDGSQPARLVGHDDWIRALCPIRLPDGSAGLASGGDDEIIRLWDLDTGQQHSVLLGHTDWIYTLCPIVLPDGTPGLASAGDEDIIRIWNLLEGEQLAPLSGHNGWIRAICTMTLSDGCTALASTGEDETVCLWEIASGEMLTSVCGQTAQIEAVCQVTVKSRGTGLAMVNDDGAVRMWDVEKGELISILVGLNGVVGACPFIFADGLVGVAVGDEREIRVWDAGHRHPPVTFLHHIESLRALCQVDRRGCDAALAGTGADGVIRIFDVQHGKQVAVLVGDARPVLALTGLTLPDGGHALATGGEGQHVLLHETTGDGAPTVLGRHSAPITSLSPVSSSSPSADVLASADRDGVIKIWSLASNELIATFVHAGGQVRSLTTVDLGGDGRVLVSGGGDGSLRFWQVGSWRPVAGLPVHRGAVVSVCALRLRDGSAALASAGRDGSVVVHKLDGSPALILVAVETSESWLAYREGSVIGDGAPVAWGANQALTRMLLVGGRWNSVDVRLSYPDALREIAPPTMAFG